MCVSACAGVQGAGKDARPVPCRPLWFLRLRLGFTLQARAQRVNFENSNHLVDASFHSGKLTNCHELKWSGQGEQMLWVDFQDTPVPS